MSPNILDSRMGLGSDIERRAPKRRSPESTTSFVEMIPIRTVRVVVGHLGSAIRMSAPEIGVFVERDTIQGTWAAFLDAVRDRDDAGWLAFDVGPTRPEEIEEGLDAPEDEEWAQLFGETGAD